MSTGDFTTKMHNPKNTTPHYCTYFDSRYLSRGLSLYDSLRKVAPSFHLWILCLDDICYDAIRALKLADVAPLRLTEIESEDSEFFSVKNDRSMLEYYFTSTSVFMSFLFEQSPGIDILTYIDADIFFYKDPSFLLNQFHDASVQIVPHRYSARNRSLEKWGKYNVGWVTFRRDEAGLSCLSWWRESCIAWCYDRLEGDRFADQKYLDRFPENFSRVQIVDHVGVNVAPWNLDAGRLSRADDGALLFCGQPLIFFHFHKLRQIAPGLWRTRLSDYGARLDRVTRDCIYLPYIRRLISKERELRPLLSHPQLPDPLLRGGIKQRGPALSDGLRAMAAGLRRDSIFCTA
jgi:hypothetical protein